MRLNLGADSVPTAAPQGSLLYCEPALAAHALGAGELPANCAAVYLARAEHEN
jgi:hypothetical protein